MHSRVNFEKVGARREGGGREDEKEGTGWQKICRKIKISFGRRTKRRTDVVREASSV